VDYGSKKMQGSPRVNGTFFGDSWGFLLIQKELSSRPLNNVM
jgi:hypothetical protein